MKTGHFLGLPLACALGACVTSSAGSAPPAGQPPPRLAVSAETQPGIVSLLSPCGLTLVGNVDDLHFRMELTGERVGVREGQPSDTYVVDGLLVQVTTVPDREIAPTAREQHGVGLLRMHAIWESARLSQTLGREVEPEEVGIRTSDRMPAALLWWFPGAGANGAEGRVDTEPDGGAAPDAAVAPEGGAAEPNRPTGIAFMTAAYGQRVLVLSVQGLRGEPKSALLAKAEAWMGTVTTSSYVIWPKEVRAEIEAAIAAGQTCPGRPNAIFEPEM